MHQGEPLRGRQLSEEDVRIRPSRRGSRPRTKQRPAHDDALIAMVTAVDRGRFTCLVENHYIVAMRARELGRRSVVVGDRVGVVGDLSGEEGSLARIVRVEPRSTTLRRTADDADPYERVVVANAELLVIVVAVTNPPPHMGFIDRCLVAALAGGLSPTLCVTKVDLGSPDKLREYYSDLDISILTSSVNAEPTELRQQLSGRVSALIGQSGVGKSTLVNRLVPHAARAVGEVSTIGKGRHISSSAIALPLSQGGWVIDTPGIRSFGLAHVQPDDLLTAFPDLVAGMTRCPPHCRHERDATECALDSWVSTGHASPRRLASFRRLISSFSA